MACTIAGESGGEQPRGQVEVGRTILARLVRKGYPKSICGITKEAHVVRSRVIHQFDGAGGLRGRACEAQFKYAQIALSEGPGKATNFHATYMNPGWRLARLYTIGGHAFYADRNPVTSWQKYADLKQKIFGGERTRYAQNYSTNSVE